eukprot:PLAT10064.3.p1 GENE.PLAT10064.3~~PLAT10064.3.p1  ORF type:complete len:420 (+),score=140.25 PLAT10064.3:72-1331(+)
MELAKFTKYIDPVPSSFTLSSIGRATREKRRRIASRRSARSLKRPASMPSLTASGMYSSFSAASMRWPVASPSSIVAFGSVCKESGELGRPLKPSPSLASLDPPAAGSLATLLDGSDPDGAGADEAVLDGVSTTMPRRHRLPVELPRGPTEAVLSKAEACKPGQYLVVEEERFEGGRVRSPRLRAVDLPPALRDGAPAAALMAPSDRRQGLQLAIHRGKVGHLRRRAAAERGRLQQLLSKRHPDGLVGRQPLLPGGERPATAGELDAAGRRADMRERRRRFERVAEKRRDLLAEHTLRPGFLGCSAEKLIMAASPKKRPRKKKAALAKSRRKDSLIYERGFQRKAGVKAETNSFERLFRQPVRRIPTARRQRIRNETLAGRNFDIVTGALLKEAPPTIPEKRNRRAEHPSVFVAAAPIR